MKCMKNQLFCDLIILIFYIMTYKNVLELIGHTPEVKINRLFGEKANVFIKLERLNPGGSIKDRIALAMIEDAEAKGILKKRYRNS